MTGAAPRREALVGEALALCAREVEALGQGRWHIGLVNGKPFAAQARLDEGWLVLEAEPAAAHDAPAWDLLRRNGAIPGNGKFLRTPEGRTLLRAEVPAWERADATRVAEACRSLEEAFGCAGDGQPGQGAGNHPGVATSGAPDLATMARLLGEAGWTCLERTGEDVAVPLDVPGAVHHARIEPRPRGEIGIGVEVLAVPALAPAARRALGRLLLLGCGHLRLARAAATMSATGDAVRFELGFGSMPSAAELDLALGALSAACCSFGREIKALALEEVASAYLDLVSETTQQKGCES